MTKSFPIILIAMFLGACGERGENSVSLHHYNSTDQIYKKALKLANSEHPSYFPNAKKLGIDNQIKAIPVFTKDHECVYFINTSTIIIEETLPIYCFKYGSLELSHKL
ncbi:hypothetical protein AB1K62_00710 [Parasphingorhabdus sp. JC815]|uniref:hypothetical protein n=1 Tax=Parasphingorhabdus sp. JC815 TaxID=3232140 RepID=UPI00345908F4